MLQHQPCLPELQAKVANTEASTVRQNGYLKAALQGTLDKATKVTFDLMLGTIDILRQQLW